MIVKTILRKYIPAERVVHRDAQSYFAILLDDNNRKTICRLYLGTRKHIGLLDENKVETKQELTSIDDIFQYTDQLVEVVNHYDRTSEGVNT